MAKYLIKVTYKADGAKGLVKEGGTGRRAVVKGLIEGVGGKLESFYFAYGDPDAYIVVDLPDPSAGIALSLAVNSSGTVHISTVPLITCEEIDAAAKKLPAYRAPGS